jgi:hypothetical protein
MLTRRDRAGTGCLRSGKRVQRAQCSCLGRGLCVDLNLELVMCLKSENTLLSDLLPMRLAHAV